MGTFIRTCQECGNCQKDNEPDRNKELSDNFKNKKCKVCQSEALDYGSVKGW